MQLWCKPPHVFNLLLCCSPLLLSDVSGSNCHQLQGHLGTFILCSQHLQQCKLAASTTDYCFEWHVGPLAGRGTTVCTCASKDRTLPCPPLPKTSSAPAAVRQTTTSPADQLSFLADQLSFPRCHAKDAEPLSSMSGAAAEIVCVLLSGSRALF